MLLDEHAPALQMPPLHSVGTSQGDPSVLGWQVLLLATQWNPAPWHLRSSLVAHDVRQLLAATSHA